MNQLSTDLRGLLHYVPQFRGKLFVVDLEWSLMSEASKAEVIMDLTALQSIGVRLLVVASNEGLEDFVDWATDHELKLSSVIEDMQEDFVQEVLERGQAALCRRSGGLLDHELSKLAQSLSAKKMIAIAEFKPVELNGEQLKFLRISEIEELEVQLTEKESELLARAAEACRIGIDRVHLLDSRVPGVLLDELFSNEGVGTMVYSGTYRHIRLLREEDISELLAMIGRSVRRTHLVPRSYEQIASSLDDYAVMEVDGHVVGCVALYSHGKRGEIACLYVKQSHEGTGYGADLVHFMHDQARARGMESVFALTNRASRFFTESLAYSEMAIESLPAERREQLRNSGRDSLAFCYTL
ncbi:GNAT family N-acetyltransferase [Rubritalea spongiae]|uniref:GNAT family N-acetyltransferase n=1 Tax=Rubritalea spongiae TaxID=430797 RepID=A0ABW5E443_9BACT